MSNDALERLKKRQRPNVPSRDASLSSPSQDISTSRYQETKTSRDQDTEISRDQDSETSRDQDTEISGDQDTDIEISGKPPEQLLTKQSTLRLEASLSQRLSEVCQDNGLSREVLIEALFEHYSNDPEAWQAILAEAKRRGERRMQMANLKRAKSMMQRFG
jgi:predicted DNA-binding protein